MWLELVWVRWTTPSTEQEFTIPVTVTGGGSVQATINIKIIDLDKNPPPNPVADDRNDGFTRASLPSKPQVTSLSWGVWSPWWQANWEWESDWQWVSNVRWVSNWIYYEGYGWYDYGYYYDFGSWYDFGEWVDNGEWKFNYNSYSASVNATMTVKPDDKSPTASGKTMKSGYGINIDVRGNVSTTQSSAVTPPQTAVTYFPEFRYETYWRLLEKISGGYSPRFEFKQNKYSTYNRRTHFSPIWIPDGRYDVYTYFIDSWTPAGMLSVNLNDYVTIQGNLWMDWHVSPMRP